MPGLHHDLLTAALKNGIALELGRAVPWLSGRGHLDDVVVTNAPEDVVDALGSIHAALGGQADVLATKRRGNPPTPDLVHVPTGCVVEVDEVQHFTTARELSLKLYLPGVPFGFDVDEYRSLIDTWRHKADSAYAHRTSADFPNQGGRQAQRAYNDALRDLLAPTFTGHPVVRIPVPDRSLDGALETLVSQLQRLG